MNQNEQFDELQKCLDSVRYFITNYVKILDPIIGEWIPFILWAEQETSLDLLRDNSLIIILKARQLGLTWLVLAFFLWRMMFRPICTILLFSRRDAEAVHLLDDRLKGMYKELPDWLKVGQEIVEDSAHEWQLSNESVARAFPTSAGDSYAATAALVDEADLVVDLNRLMRAVKPTIDAGGQMILLSRSDKQKPASTFKAIYRGAKTGENDWVHLFLPWYLRPGRDDPWYEKQKRDILSRTGSLDDLHEQYPTTDTEALAPGSKDKRVPGKWLEACYEERKPLGDMALRKAGIPAISGLDIFLLPIQGRKYVIGIDPAEGNPTSNESALTVVDRHTQEEISKLAGRIEIATFAAHCDQIGKFYNDAGLMVERNNHGHAILLWLRDNSRLKLLEGHDGKIGWMSSTRGKTLLYSITAEAARDAATTIHSFDTYLQLCSIEGASLRAPDGERDDLADSYALALCGCISYEMVTVWDDTLTVEVAY